MIDEPKRKDLPSFNIIKHRGDPTHAVTLDNHKVEKTDKVFIPEMGAFVRCMDYHGEHFVYLDPECYPPHNRQGRWFAMCTCGSPAVIVGQDAYKTEGGFLACYFHAQFGRHVTSDGKAWS